MFAFWLYPKNRCVANATKIAMIAIMIISSTNANPLLLILPLLLEGLPPPTCTD